LKQDVSTREHLEHASFQTLADGRRARSRVARHNPEFRFGTAGDDVEHDLFARLKRVARTDDGAILTDAIVGAPADLLSSPSRVSDVMEAPEAH